MNAPHEYAAEGGAAADGRGRTLWQALEVAAAANPARELLVLPAARYSYGEVLAAARYLSDSLLRLGVRRGDPVAIWLPNEVEWVVTAFAAARIGAVILGINTRLRADEIRYLLSHSRATVLVVSHRRGGVDFAELAYALVPELRGGDVPLQSAALPALRHVLYTGHGPPPGMFSWPTLAAPSAERTPPFAPPAPGDLALVQYTSGSTGQPKGAMLSHASITRNAFEFGRRMGQGPEDRLFAANPFFHVAGFVVGLQNVVAHRATLVTMERYEAGAALALLERERCTGRLGLDLMYRREMEHPDFPRRDLSALRKGTMQGAAEVFRQAYHRMGMRDIISAYALSEAAATVCTTLPSDPLRVRATTVGRPQSEVEVRVADPDSGAPLPPGRAGEVHVRGWNVMQGYYHDPAATAQALDADGWLHTGDLGHLDAQGRLVFGGRLKDVVRVGGENVAAAEVENLLLGHPAVQVVQVVPAPDRDLGEVPVAFVELRPGATCRVEELFAYCEGRLARFKQPRAYELVSEWPQTGSGKIPKVALRDRAAALWANRPRPG